MLWEAGSLTRCCHAIPPHALETREMGNGWVTVCLCRVALCMFDGKRGDFESRDGCGLLCVKMFVQGF